MANKNTLTRRILNALSVDSRTPLDIADLGITTKGTASGILSFLHLRGRVRRTKIQSTSRTGRPTFLYSLPRLGFKEKPRATKKKHRWASKKRVQGEKCLDCGMIRKGTNNGPRYGWESEGIWYEYVPECKSQTAGN